MSITPTTIEVNFLNTVELSFQAAYNSNGIANSVTSLNLEQTNVNGISVANHTVQQDPNGTQMFSITFTAVGSLSGTFSACKCHHIDS